MKVSDYNTIQVFIEEVSVKKKKKYFTYTRVGNLKNIVTWKSYVWCDIILKVKHVLNYHILQIEN